MTPPDRPGEIDPRLRERLSAYLDGEASPEEAREIRAWLESDPAALREAEELRRVWDLLGRYPDENVREGFADAVLARVRGDALPAPRPGLRFLAGGGAGRRVAVAAGLVLALGVGAVAAARLLGPSPLPPSETSTLEALPAEAVENLSDLAALSDAQFEAILSSDPEELARLLDATQGG